MVELSVPPFFYPPTFIFALKFRAELSITNYEIWFTFPWRKQGEFCLELCLLYFLRERCVRRVILIVVLVNFRQIVVKTMTVDFYIIVNNLLR